MKREPSKYQQEILDWVKNGSGSGIVNALAGTGKTTTLTMVAEAVPSKMLFLAFNKHIADELKERKELKPLIDGKKLKIYTVNALGNMAVIDYCKNTLKKEPVLKSNKLYSDILDGVILDRLQKENRRLPEDRIKNKVAMDTIKQHTKTCCDLVRAHCIDYKNLTAIERLIDDERLFVFRKEILMITTIPRLEWSLLVSEAIEESIDFFEKTGEYDFIEQIYLPVKLNMYPPIWLKWYCDFVASDECIPFDYYVKTDKGLIKMQTLYNRINDGERICAKTFNEQTQDFEYKPIVNVVEKGVKPVFKIKTEGLKIIEATSNHPFLTQRGWVKVEGLKIREDYLICDNPINQKTKFLLNDDQYQVALASCIGDGSLEKQSEYNTFRIKFVQQEKQLDYLHFKKKMFNCESEYTFKSGYTGRKDIYSSSTKVFIHNGNLRKELDKMDERGFAIWYMDDGSMSCGEFHSTKISCNNLTKEEADILENRLKDFGIFVKRVLVKGKYQEFHFSVDNAKKFLKLIAPYMHKDCFYKNPYSTGEYDWDFSGYKKCGGDYIKSIEYSRDCKVFDMEVQDNHNFIIAKSGSNKNGAGIIVHNCQDLSTLQQAFIKKLQYLNPYQPTRYLFVGDEHQAIYKFNGADSNSINHIREQFNAHDLYLNICYRCPKKAIKLAKTHAPLIEESPTAQEGKINIISNLNVANYTKAGDLVMARKNKDLVSVYLQLIKNKQKVYFKKGDFLFRIVKEIDERKKVKTLKDIEAHIEKIQTRELNKKLNEGKNESKNVIDMEEDDIYDIMFSLLDFFKNNYKDLKMAGTALGFTNFVRTIAQSEPSNECITVGSIHAMKGLEANNVFIVNYFEMPYEFGMGAEYSRQEKNLKYIAETRTKENLYLCYDEQESIEAFVDRYTKIIDFCDCQKLDK